MARRNRIHSKFSSTPPFRNSLIGLLGSSCFSPVHLLIIFLYRTGLTRSRIFDGIKMAFVLTSLRRLSIAHFFVLLLVGSSLVENAVANKPVKHIVMFSFRQGTSKSDIKHIRRKLLDLPRQIPEITTFELGKDLGLRSGQIHPAGKNRMIAWTATFASKQHYEIYSEHQAHKEFLDVLKSKILPGSRAAIQYEVTKECTSLCNI